MTTETHIKNGKYTALISLLLGTVILWLYYYTSDSLYLLIGYGFILLMFIINLGVLSGILVKAKQDKTNRKRLVQTSGLMLLNIPVMIVYSWLGFILLDTMRITFTNGHESSISDINIIGCGGGFINELKPNESKTLWISITGDCSINVEYLLNNERNKETVAGYVTTSAGQKIKHNIDGMDKDII